MCQASITAFVSDPIIAHRSFVLVALQVTGSLFLFAKKATKKKTGTEGLSLTTSYFWSNLSLTSCAIDSDLSLRSAMISLECPAA